MPTYSYACKNCGHAFDAVQSFQDAALTVCPECGGRLHKHYGSIGVTFRGSGFYRTDSRSAKTAHTGPARHSSGETAAASGGAKTASATSSTSGATASAAPAAS